MESKADTIKRELNFNDFLGVPFSYGGRDKTGMDCFGVVIEYFKRWHGIDIDDPCEYSEKFATKDNDAFEKHKGKNWLPIRGGLQEGDVLIFHDRGCGVGTHCAVYLSGDRLLHATEKIGVIISKFRQYRTKFLKAYRWRDL